MVSLQRSSQLDPSSPTTAVRADQPTALIVADGSCPQIRDLLARTALPVLWLQATDHPFDILSQELNWRRQLGNPVANLHWISHGSAGQLHVGNHTISSQSLIDRHQQLAQWGLQKLMLWSCSTGAESSFISLLEEFSGATVWASRLPLGQLGHGFTHWKLTSRDDAPSPQLPINAQQLLSWPHQLAAFPRSGGGTLQDQGYAITSLSDNSSIVTGYFNGTATFGSTTLTSAGSKDVFIAKLDSNGDYVWAKQGGGSSDDTTYGITSLSDNSSIVTGRFSGSATFGSTTLTSAGNDDVFIAKLDSNGNYLWAKRGGSNSDDKGYAITSLSDNSSIVTGEFQGTATFGSTTLTSAGNNDVFIAKLDSNGNYLWAKRGGSSSDDRGYGITSLSDNSSIVTGFFNGTATFGSTTLTSAGSYDVFIAKLDSNGNYLWAKRGGSSSDDRGIAITSLSDNSSIVTGYFNGTATFGSTTLTSAGSKDVFIAKIDGEGNYLWAKQGGSSSADRGVAITSLSDNSSIVTGDFYGTATFGSTTLTSAGDKDVFIAKLDSNGDYLWAKNAGGTGREIGRGISVLSDNSTIVTGDFLYSATFGSNTLTSAGSYDVFIAKLDSNGDWWIDPAMTSASYNASTGVLSVTGTNFKVNAGADNDIDISKLTLTGEGSSTYTLTSDDVERTSATAFSVTLNAADQLQLAGLLNKNGTSSGGSTTYNIAAALNWNPGSSSSPADSTGNAITVSNVAAPSLSSASYDDSSGVLALTGSNLPAYSGSSNDIDVSKLTITGGSGSTYTLTTGDVELTSATAASITLNSTDQSNLDSLLNKNGTASTQGTTYNIAAADDWAPGADSSVNIEDLTGNAVTVSNIPNRTPTGSVTISGTPTQGQTLTAANTLADADGLGTITNQWKRAGAAISGATSTSYELVQADVGSAISVTASYTDGGGTAESVTSTATSAVANVNDAPTGSVTISGTPTQGQTLTAANTLADADGLGTITNQWKRAGSSISGATSTSYELVQADVGSAISVTASYTDGGGTAESVTSTATSAVANVNDAPTGSVTISGTATQGQTLTAANTLADADGLGTITNQWKRAGSSISGATSTSYELVQADVGSAISVTASYTDGAGTAESVTSTATSAVANVNDAPTGSVTISGTPTQGQTLTASHTLADADGLGTIAYGWRRSGTAINIPDPSSTTYTLVQADVGSAISVTASYTDQQGTAESVSSSATSAVKALVTPTPTPTPTPASDVSSSLNSNSNTAQTLENLLINGRRYWTHKVDSLINQSNFNFALLNDNDYLEVTGGKNNYANGNKGDDRFVLRAGQKGQYFGGKGADTFEVFGGIDSYINGDKGADQIILRGGLGRYLGGDDGDRIEVLAADSGSWVNGNRGNDFITGAAAGVTYRGGKDDDVLAVSQGDVWGDLGIDTFRGVSGDGYALIQDYTVGEDKIDLAMIQGGSWTNVDNGLMFTDLSGDQIMLLLGIKDSEQVTLI